MTASSTLSFPPPREERRFSHELSPIPYNVEPLYLADVTHEFRDFHAVHYDSQGNEVVIEDETQWVCDNIIQECDKLRHKTGADAPKSENFMWNDRLQQAQRQPLVSWQSLSTWRQCEELVKELRNFAQPRAEAAHHSYMLGGPRFAVKDSLFIHVWANFHQANRFRKGFQRLAQSIFEHSFEGLHVPFTLFLTVQGSQVSVTPLMPLADVRPIPYKETGTLLNAMMLRLPKTMYVPDTGQTVFDIPVHRGVDGRWYLISLKYFLTPHAFNHAISYPIQSLRLYFMSGQEEQMGNFLTKTIAQKVANTLVQTIEVRMKEDKRTGAKTSLESLLDKELVQKAIRKHGANMLLLFQVLVELDVILGRVRRNPALGRTKKLPAPEPKLSQAQTSAQTAAMDSSAPQVAPSTQAELMKRKSTAALLRKQSSAQLPAKKGSQPVGPRRQGTMTTAAKLKMLKRKSLAAGQAGTSGSEGESSPGGGGTTSSGGEGANGGNSPLLKSSKSSQQLKKQTAESFKTTHSFLSGNYDPDEPVDVGGEQVKSESGDSPQPTPTNAAVAATASPAGKLITNSPAPKPAMGGTMGGKGWNALKKKVSIVAPADSSGGEGGEALTKKQSEPRLKRYASAVLAGGKKSDPDVEVIPVIIPTLDEEVPKPSDLLAADINVAAVQVARKCVVNEMAIRCVKEVVRAEIHAPHHNEDRFHVLMLERRVNVVNRISAELFENPNGENLWKNLNEVARYKFCASDNFTFDPSEILVSHVIRYAPIAVGCVYDNNARRFKYFKTVQGEDTFIQMPDTLRMMLVQNGDIKTATKMIASEWIQTKQAASPLSLTRQAALLRLATHGMLIMVKLSNTIMDELYVDVKNNEHIDHFGKIFALADLVRVHSLVGDPEQAKVHVAEHLTATANLTTEIDLPYRAERERISSNLLREMRLDKEAARLIVESINSVDRMGPNMRHDFSTVHLNRLLQATQMCFDVQAEKHAEHAIHEALKLVDNTAPVKQNKFELSAQLLAMPTETDSGEDGMQTLKRIATTSVAFHVKEYGQMSHEACTARNILAQILMNLGEDMDPELRGDVLVGLEVLEGKGDAIITPSEDSMRPPQDGDVLSDDGDPDLMSDGGVGDDEGKDGNAKPDAKTSKKPKPKPKRRVQSQAHLEAQQLLAANGGKQEKLAPAQQAKLMNAIKTNKRINEFAARMRIEMRHLAEREEFWRQFCFSFISIVDDELTQRMDIAEFAEEHWRREVLIVSQYEKGVRRMLEDLHDLFTRYLAWKEHGAIIELIEKEDRHKVFLWEQSDVQRISVREEYIHRCKIQEVQRTTRRSHLLTRLEYLNRRVMVMAEAERRQAYIQEERFVAIRAWQKEEQRFRQHWNVEVEQDARRSIYAYEETVMRRKLITREAKERDYSVRFMNFIGLEFALRSVEYWESVARPQVNEDFLLGHRQILECQARHLRLCTSAAEELSDRETIYRSQILDLERKFVSMAALTEVHECLNRQAIIAEMCSITVFACEVWEEYHRAAEEHVEVVEREALEAEISQLRRTVGTTPASRTLEVHESRGRRDITFDHISEIATWYADFYEPPIRSSLIAQEVNERGYIAFLLRQNIVNVFIVEQEELGRLENLYRHQMWEKERAARREVIFAAELRRRDRLTEWWRGGLTLLCERQETLERARIATAHRMSWLELVTFKYPELLHKTEFYKSEYAFRQITALRQEEMWARIIVEQEEREEIASLVSITFEVQARDQVVADWETGFVHYLIWHEVADRTDEKLIFLDELEFSCRSVVEGIEAFAATEDIEPLNRELIELKEQEVWDSFIAWHRRKLVAAAQLKLLQQAENGQRASIDGTSEKEFRKIQQLEIECLREVQDEMTKREAAALAAQREKQLEEARLAHERRKVLEQGQSDRERAALSKEITVQELHRDHMERVEEPSHRRKIELEQREELLEIHSDAMDEARQLYLAGHAALDPDRERGSSAEIVEETSSEESIDWEAIEAEQAQERLTFEMVEELAARKELEMLLFARMKLLLHDEFIARETMFRNMVLRGRRIWERRKVQELEWIDRCSLIYAFDRVHRVMRLLVASLIFQTIHRRRIFQEQRYRRRVLYLAEETSLRANINIQQRDDTLWLEGMELNPRFKLIIKEAEIRRGIVATTKCFGDYEAVRKEMIQKRHAVERMWFDQFYYFHREPFQQRLVVSHPRSIMEGWEQWHRDAVEKFERESRFRILKLSSLAPLENDERDVILQSEHLEWAALMRKEEAWGACVRRWADDPEPSPSPHRSVKPRPQWVKEVGGGSSFSKEKKTADGIGDAIAKLQRRKSAADISDLKRAEEQKQDGKITRSNDRSAKGELPPLQRAPPAPKSSPSVPKATTPTPTATHGLSPTAKVQIVSKQQKTNKSPPKANSPSNPISERTSVATTVSRAAAGSSPPPQAQYHGRSERSVTPEVNSGPLAAMRADITRQWKTIKKQEAERKPPHHLPSSSKHRVS